ncbi:MAG: [Fe-S]-binding protein [Thermoleophilia bacterium]|nr:[Fe-S]-binding protein [Thermoleophilia bacterium]
MDADRSLWTARDSARPAYPPLAGELEVDVAVVGGGIVGATAALLLANEGRSVALLEARRLGGGITGNSTAKMTYLHGGWVADLVDQVGSESAHAIVHGERAALDLVRHWVAELGIDDAARAATNWLYGSTAKGRERLEREHEACVALKVPTRWAEDGEVPFGEFALGLDDQLNIEPAVIVAAFAAHAAMLGAHVHEGTRVTEVSQDDDTTTLTSADGATVRAAHVVIATHVPILDRSTVFAAADYHRSHVVALEHPDALTFAPDMYTGVDPGTLSVRAAVDEDGTQLLVVAGDGHSLHDREDGSHVEELEAKARDLTGGGARRRAWLAHDIFPTDGHPFVGPIHGRDDTYIATGYGGWGLSGGVAGAMAIAGMILRGHSAWQPPQSARRLGPYLSIKAAKEGLITAKSVIVDRLNAQGGDVIDELAPGQGVIARVHGRTVAASRDDAGTLRVVDATCTHMGCIVEHDDERACWQCPCHGSRFALDGEVLHGPATKPLAPVDAADLA